MTINRGGQILSESNSYIRRILKVRPVIKFLSIIAFGFLFQVLLVHLFYHNIGLEIVYTFLKSLLFSSLIAGGYLFSHLFIDKNIYRSLLFTLAFILVSWMEISIYPCSYNCPEDEIQKAWEVLGKYQQLDKMDIYHQELYSTEYNYPRKAAALYKFSDEIPNKGFKIFYFDSTMQELLKSFYIEFKNRRIRTNNQDLKITYKNEGVFYEERFHGEQIIFKGDSLGFNVEDFTNYNYEEGGLYTENGKTIKGGVTEFWKNSNSYKIVIRRAYLKPDKGFSTWFYNFLSLIK